MATLYHTVELNSIDEKQVIILTIFSIMNCEMQNIHKESKSTPSSDNQQGKSNFQTYKDYSDNFQRQVEKTVTQRNELFGKVYLEYLKHYKQVTDKIFEYQDNFLTKNGSNLNADL